MPDLGFTHVAFAVRSAAASIEFYERFTDLTVVHSRVDGGSQVTWMSDGRRPFVLVIAEGQPTEPPLGPFGHLGMSCRDTDEVDSLAALAAEEGCLVRPPEDSGHPVGYWALLRDPDGNIVELSFGQEVAATVERADPDPAARRRPRPVPRSPT